MSKNTETNNKTSNWEELKDNYITVVNTYRLISQYLNTLYTKYKPIVDDRMDIKKTLDGAQKTLDDIKKIIVILSTRHIVETDENDKSEKFKSKDGKYYKFKDGPINEENEEEIKTVIETLVAYKNLLGNMYITVKNATAIFITDIEKAINSIEDEQEKEKYLKLLGEDKEEYNNTLAKSEGDTNENK